MMKSILSTPCLALAALAITVPASAEFNFGKAIQKGIEISQQQKRYSKPAPQAAYQPKPMQVYQPKPMPTYQPAPVPKPTYRPKPSPKPSPKPAPKPAPKPPVQVTPNVSKMVSALKGSNTAVSSAPSITNRTTKIAPTIAPKGYENFYMKRGRESAEGSPTPPVTATRVKDGRPSAEGAPISNPGSGSVGRPTPSAPPANLSYQVDSNSQLATSSVRFRKGSTDLADQASFQYLQNLASALQDPSLISNRFVVEGHASADGSDYNNLLLSQRRANAIFDFLLSQGVAPDRLLAVGHGESQARFRPGDPEYLLAQDRQVVVFKLAD